MFVYSFLVTLDVNTKYGSTYYNYYCIISIVFKIILLTLGTSESEERFNPLSLAIRVSRCGSQNKYLIFAMGVVSH